MSYPCPRCGTRLVETDDEVNDYELEVAQVRHTVKRCSEIDSLDGDETELLDDDGVWVDTGVPARPEQKT